MLGACDTYKDLYRGVNTKNYFNLLLDAKKFTGKGIISINYFVLVSQQLPMKKLLDHFLLTKLGYNLITMIVYNLLSMLLLR